MYSNPALDIDVDDKVKIGDDENQRTLEYGDIIFTGSSETPDECGISSVLTQQTDEKLYLNSFCFVFRFDDTSIMLPDFSKHLFRSSELRYQIGKTANGVTRFNVSKKQMRQVKLPVPPLEVQREIVRILDSFTLLTAELTAELTARKRQYEFYRDDLLTFSNNEVEFKSFGELFDVRNGLNKGKEFFGHGSPIINFTDVYNNRWLAKDSFTGTVEVTPDEIERYSAKKGDVFFTRTSETKEDIGMTSTLIEDVENCVFSGFVLRARPKTDLLLPKFCAYYFSSTAVRNTIVRYASFTTRATTTGEKLSKILVPILSKEKQEKIVYVLDNFDAICSDLNIGLPAEIEARQKQYEYYRDALLTYAATGKIIAQTDRQTSIIKLIQFVYGSVKISLKNISKHCSSGSTPKKGNSAYYKGGTIPWLRTQDVRFNEIYEATAFITELAVKETSAKWIPENCVIVAMSGASAGRCAINKIPLTTNQHCLNIEIDPNMALYKYVFYCVCSQYEELLSRKEGARGDLNASRILSLEIPLPSLKEQERIVGILDRFDALCNDLSSGLPAEIEARQKQYEYYRDRLLNFEPITK